MKLTLQEAVWMMAENGGNLDLRYEQYAELPDGLTVDGSLNISGTKIKDLPKGLTVGGSLYMNRTKIKELPEGLTVGGGLYMNGTGITELPEGLVFKGDLDISETKIWKLPEGLTVGGDLYMDDTDIKELPESLVVAGDIYWDGKTCGSPTPLRQGDYAPGRYLFADGILTQISKKKTFGGYDVYVGKIKGRNVVSDGTYYAHCDKIRDGIEDLRFKGSEARRSEQYRGLPLDSELTPDEAITMYRVITGACRQGTQAFVDSLGKLKELYSIGEIIALTEGQYGAGQFKQFFGQ